jgi:HK97 family phage portal protein
MADSIIKSFLGNINKVLRIDPGRGTPVPRKGLFSFVNTTVNKKQQRQFVLNAATLGKLANTDPITWAIRRTIKGYISGIPWDIIPDTQQLETELDRWEDHILTYINPYEFDTTDFKSEILPKDLQEEITYKIETILDDTSIDDSQKRDRIRWLFKTTSKRLRHEAESHKHKVKGLFAHPNNSETSFRVLLELLLDDILIYDAGALVKNYNYYGNIAELYTLPGHEIKIYRNEDGTMPDPPEPAYAWEDKGVLRAEFCNDELLYIMQNPQHNGYGSSPLEVASYIITASLYADEYNIDYFKHSNVPPGIVSLGENVTEDQRKLFQKMWEEEVQGRGGLHKLVFTSGSEKMQFIPMRVQTNRDMQMMEYLKWTTAIKCACYGISPQDIGFVLDFHRTTAEVQEKLSRTRGVNNLLNLLESYFNEEIVKAEFPFKDVKFNWQLEDSKSDIQQVQIDRMDLDSGVISINERRKIRGMKPIEGGDEYYIKGASAMLPVSDLPKLDEAKLEGQPMAQPPMDVTSQLGSLDAANQTAGIMPEQPISGEPGRPTTSEAENAPAKIGNQIKMVVSKRGTSKDQINSLNKTVDALKQQGINATLRIGFSDNDVTKEK